MSGERGGRRSDKEQTVLVDVGDNRSVSAMSVIKSVEEKVGEGEVLACVPKSGNLFEITLKENDSVELICDTGFEVKGSKFKPNAVFSRERMVSFLNVSYYVPDEEIRKKLEEFGAELVTPIKRRMHPGTQTADGTRYVVVRFPVERQSLPYTMRFPTGVNSFEYIRVIHDNQQKVCTKCFESNHVYANCPDNICYRCKSSGHLAKSCPKPPCPKCKQYLAKCTCEPEWGDGVQNHDDMEDENVEQQEGEDDDQPDDDDDADDDDDDDTDDDVDEGDKDDVVNDAEAMDDETDEAAVKDDVLKVDVNDNDTLDLNSNVEMKSNEQSIDDNIKYNTNTQGGSNRRASVSETVSHVENNATGVSGTNTDSSVAGKSEEVEMSDEELARNMLKIRRRKLVTGPSLTPEDIKRLRSHPRHQLSHSSS